MFLEVLCTHIERVKINRCSFSNCIWRACKTDILPNTVLIIFQTSRVISVRKWSTKTYGNLGKVLIIITLTHLPNPLYFEGVPFTDTHNKDKIVHKKKLGVRDRNLQKKTMYCTKSTLILYWSWNSADPDEMQLYAAFRLGLYCLPKCPFRDFQYTKG